MGVEEIRRRLEAGAYSFGRRDMQVVLAALEACRAENTDWAERAAHAHSDQTQSLVALLEQAVEAGFISPEQDAQIRGLWIASWMGAA